MTDTPTPPAPPTPPAAARRPPTTPWYEGKLDAELIGHIENKGWKKDDPVAVASKPPSRRANCRSISACRPTS
jgi:hypothetical protein